MTDVIENAYLVITYPDNSAEIFDRRYQLISKSQQEAIMIAERKTEVESWRDYRSPISDREGDAKWYLPVPSENLTSDQIKQDKLDMENACPYKIEPKEGVDYECMG